MITATCDLCGKKVEYHRDLTELKECYQIDSIKETCKSCNKIADDLLASIRKKCEAKVEEEFRQELKKIKEKYK